MSNAIPKGFLLKKNHQTLKLNFQNMVVEGQIKQISISMLEDTMKLGKRKTWGGQIAL
jgi:hypothetical protein